MGLVSMGLQLENPVKGPFSWVQICHGSTLPAEEYLSCSSLKFLAASCHHPPLQGASAYCSADSEKFLHLTLLFLIYIQVSVLIENVSWWLVTAQHTPGERCPSFSSQPRWESSQGGHRALPGQSPRDKWVSDPACGPAKSLLGAVYRGLKQRGASAASPFLWDKQVLVFLEEKSHPNTQQLLNLVT